MRFLQAPLNGDSQQPAAPTLDDIARDVVAATSADAQSLDAAARSRVLTAIRARVRVAPPLAARRHAVGVSCGDRPRLPSTRLCPDPSPAFMRSLLITVRDTNTFGCSSASGTAEAYSASVTYSWCASSIRMVVFGEALWACAVNFVIAAAELTVHGQESRRSMSSRRRSTHSASVATPSSRQNARRHRYRSRISSPTHHWSLRRSTGQR
jgi:hypothetical protein